MGSSGRSTGPHVHFEVFRHGRAVDPASYVRRTNR
jgi:murein DD-endopeptidase MepM/ murein hydrolase activator NlpD